MPEQEQLSDEQKKEQERLAAEQAEAERTKNSTQQTEFQEDPRIKKMQEQLDGINSSISQLIQLNHQNVQKATVEAPKPMELPSNKEVWDNPVEAIGKIMAVQTAPLNKIASELAADRALANVKSQIEMTPQYQRAKAMYPDFERHFAYQLSQVPGNQLNTQAASFVLSSVVGSLALNAPVAEPNKPVTITTTPSNAVANVPAHLRPSAPNAPVRRNEEAEPELNENETILARRYGMTPKEYKAMQGGDRLVLDPLNQSKGA